MTGRPVPDYVTVCGRRIDRLTSTAYLWGGPARNGAIGIAVPTREQGQWIARYANSRYGGHVLLETRRLPSPRAAARALTRLLKVWGLEECVK